MLLQEHPLAVPCCPSCPSAAHPVTFQVETAAFSSRPCLRSNPARDDKLYCPQTTRGAWSLSDCRWGCRVGAAAPSDSVGMALVRPRARPEPFGLPVWWPARPVHRIAPGRPPAQPATGRASRAVRSVRRPASGRAPGRASRWGWRSAPGPAAAGGRRPRRPAAVMSPDACASFPPLDLQWAAGRPCPRRWLGPRRLRSCRPDS
jgi:hypothetical protein